MALRIKLKNSVVHNRIPTTSDLPAVGELAVNANINSIGGFMRASDNSIVKIFGPGSLSTPAASDTVAGISELATNAETTGGTATDKVVTPAGLNAVTVAERSTSNSTYLALTGGSLSGGLTVSGTVAATALSGDGSALTSIPAGELTGTVADARITSLTASKLTGALPAIDGSALTHLPAAGLSNIVDDTTPQLGGNLDVQGNEINTSTTDGNIVLNPNGAGVVEVKGDGTSNGNVGTLQLNCSNNNHGVKIKSPPHSAAASYTLTLPDNDGNANQVLKTDGSGGLSWVDQTSGVTVQEEGSSLSTAGTTLNFVGAGVTASGTGATKTITVGGGGGDFELVSSTVTTSGSSYFDITNLDTDTVYKLICRRLLYNNYTSPKIQLYLDGSSSIYTSGNIDYSGFYGSSSRTTLTQQSSIVFNSGSNGTEWNFEMDFHTYVDPYIKLRGMNMGLGLTMYVRYDLLAYLRDFETNNNYISGFRISSDHGASRTILAGSTFLLYKIKTS